MAAYNDSQALCPVRSGKLKRSGYRHNVRSGFEFGYRAPYFAAVNYGVSEHDEHIAAAVRRGHLRAVPGRAQRRRIGTRVVSGYTRHIRARAGQYFIERALYPQLDRLPREIAANIRTIRL